MNVDKMIAIIGYSVLDGLASDITSEMVEKRLQEAKKKANSDEIHFLEEMLKTHKMKEGKA